MQGTRLSYETTTAFTPRRRPTALSGATVVPAGGGRRVTTMIAVLAAICLVYLLFLWLRPLGRPVSVQVSDVVSFLGAAVACTAAAHAALRCSLAVRRTWTLFALACGFWAFGEAAWTWSEVVGGQAPTGPSWADVGYLGGPLLAGVALALHPVLRWAGHWRIVSALDALGVASALLLVSWIFILAPVWATSGGPSFGALIAVAYPISDVVILVLAVLAWRHLPVGQRLSAGLLLGGLGCMALGDSAYTYLTQVGRYTSGDPLDSTWLVAYLAIAAAALVAKGSWDAVIDENHIGASITSTLAPYLPILVALVVVPVELLRGAHLTGAEWSIAVFLVLVVLARQLAEAARHRREKAATAEATAGVDCDLRLRLVLAALPTADERARRMANVMTVWLTSTVTLLAGWDLSLLIRGGPG